MDTTYVTEEELNTFSEELTQYVQKSIENEELSFAEVVKEFVENKLSDLEIKLVKIRIGYKLNLTLKN
jgi:hypothetical protein